MKVLGCLLVTAAGAPAAASAAGIPSIRTFAVTAEGVQSTTFTLHHAKQAQCDQGAYGSGSERVVFWAKKPEKIAVTQYRGVVNIGPEAPGANEILVKASVTRNRHVVTDPLDPRCAGNGGGAPTPAPDCGHKNMTFGVEVGWWSRKPRGLTLGTGLLAPPLLPYKNCPVRGNVLPNFLTSTTSGRQIVAPIPVSDLFDPSLRKHIVKAHGTYRLHDADGGFTTTIHWTVSLTEIPPPKAPRTVKSARFAADEHLAVAARSKPVSYRGKTRDGDPISFRVAAGRISRLSAYVPTVCLAAHGLPMSGTDPFDPPGSFRIGHTDKVKAKRPNAIWNTSDVTKNFVVTSKRDRAGRITGKLHVDYSFLQLLYTYPISARPYVCSGDTTFHLSPGR
jgi:hypothetical protein